MVLRVERGPQHPVQYDSYGVDDDNVDDDDDDEGADDDDNDTAS